MEILLILSRVFFTLFQPESVGERAVSRGFAQLAVQPTAQISVQPAAQLAVQSLAKRCVRCSKKKKKEKERKKKKKYFSFCIF
jgi:hypothetical protein